ncbi:MAG: hypothetical protein ACKVS6_16580 [Planctomycetota bacterium]
MPKRPEGTPPNSDDHNELANERVASRLDINKGDANSDPEQRRIVINAVGKRLVYIASHQGNPDEFEELCYRIQPILLAIVRERCLQDGLPLPPYLVAGRAAEYAILEGVKKPTTQFYNVLIDNLEVAIEFFKMRRLFVDRYIVETRGGKTRKQAYTAAICETALTFPLRDRQILYHWILDGWPTPRIAAHYGMAEIDVRLALANIVKAARPFVESWIARWAPRRDTSKPKRRTRKPPQ